MMGGQRKTKHISTEFIITQIHKWTLIHQGNAFSIKAHFAFALCAATVRAFASRERVFTANKDHITRAPKKK
jgi:hypothetical protein